MDCLLFLARRLTCQAGHRGSPPKSILAPWYTLVSQRRNWRLDFVKSLAKAFAVDPAGSSTTQVRAVPGSTFLPG